MGRWRRQRGLSFVELMATVMILMILAGAIIPMAKTANKRRKEMELRRALRQIRSALDLYAAYCNPNPAIPSPDPHVPPRKIAPCNTAPGPEKLEDLVKGVQYVPATGADDVVKFLRKIPLDPMTNSTDWGIRDYSQDPTETSGGQGKDVWDVFTKSKGIALNGEKYSDW
jgi:general secretion pathway protein G